jgi:hypothetical protein
VSVEVKNYITEEVEERLYADTVTIPANSTAPVKAAGDSIPAGMDGVAVSVACTQNSNSSFYLKIAGKQHYPNGLNTAGLAGLTDETLLLVPMKERQEWEVGFTNKSASDITISFRFRVRLFRRR